ncbi:MAG TPA: VOC family protein [Bacteroidota bacterium]|nr:VOC family protein [Bacteroidota bacterium]
MFISRTRRFRRVVAALMLFCAFVTLSTIFTQAQIPAARFEHIAINVANPLDVVKWYTENLGFTVERQGAAPGYSTMIVDSARNLAIEVYYNAERPLLEPSKIHHMAMHIAFAGDSILQMKERLMAHGATLAEAPKTSASGDRVFTLRDPWGLPIQFVERAKPMLAFKGTYAEHYALNVADSRAKAKWFVEQLGLTIVREGKAPSYGMFIADSSKNLMMELYQDEKYPALKFSDVDYMTTHLAFIVTDVAAVKARLVNAGATVAEEMKQLPNGDTVLMLRDPWGEPVQIVKRVAPFLK